MNTDLLQQLKGLELPAEPGFWPPAPGWWLVFACGLALSAWGSRTLIRRHKLARPRRAANAEFALLRHDFDEAKLSAVAYADAVNELLKRLLRHYQPGDEALTAFGAPWLEYLDEVSDTDAYSKGPGRVLGADRYRPNVETDWPAFNGLITKTLQRLAR